MPIVPPDYNIDVCGLNPSKKTNLFFKYRDHSIFQRMESAVKMGKEQIEIYRPRGSVSANKTTDEVLELLKIIGCSVEMRTTATPDLVLYVVSNLPKIE